MEEEDLIELGFTKEYGDDFYYYVYDVSNNCLLISSDNEDIDKWWVEFFENKNIRFKEKKELEILIQVIKRNENKRI